MSSSRIQFPGYFTFAATRQNLILAFPQGVVPVADGYNDAHITLPLSGKRVKPHITLRGPGKREERIDLADMPFDEFIAMLAGAQHEAALTWWRAQQRVTIEQLCDENWLVVRVPPRRFEDLLTCHFRVEGRSMRLMSELHELLGDVVELALDASHHSHPSSLESVPSPAPIFALRPVGADFDGWILTYVKTNPAVDTGPGWCALPLGPSTVELILEMVREKFGTALFDMLTAAEAALGFGSRASDLIVK